MNVILSFATEVQWHEGHSVARALRRLGHDVRVVNVAAHPFREHCEISEGFPADTHVAELFSKVAGPADHGPHAGKVPDLFAYIEPRGLLPRGLERAPCRTVCFLCDTILALPPRQTVAQLFDDVVLYHFNAIEAFPDHGPERVHVSPFAVDPALFVDRGSVRDCDVVYVGSLDDVWAPRRRLVERLKSEFSVNDVERRLSAAEVSDLYSRAKIIVNVCINDTLNPRIFDAMGAGALLLNGATPAALGKLFTDGVHFVSFEDEEDAAVKVRYYLGNEPERARIARAGNAAVHAKHTYDIRVRDLMDRLTSRRAPNAPARTMRSDAVYDIYEAHYRQSGHAEALIRLARGHPRWSVARVRTLARALMTAYRHR